MERNISELLLLLVVVVVVVLPHLYVNIKIMSLNFFSKTLMCPFKVGVPSFPG